MTNTFMYKSEIYAAVVQFLFCLAILYLPQQNTVVQEANMSDKSEMSWHLKNNKQEMGDSAMFLKAIRI